MHRVIALAAAALLVAGCSVPRSVKEGGPVAGQQVDRGARVLVLNVADGQEAGQPVAVGSGQIVVSSVRKALQAHGVPLTLSESTDISQGIAEAKGAGFDYVLRTKITLWEDNATAWSMKGDRLNIAIELYDADTRELVAAATHKRVATGVTWMSGSPERFIDEVVAGALGEIYGWVSPAAGG